VHHFQLDLFHRRCRSGGCQLIRHSWRRWMQLSALPWILYQPMALAHVPRPPHRRLPTLHACARGSLLDHMSWTRFMKLKA